jgi:hypothetical protein
MYGMSIIKKVRILPTQQQSGPLAENVRNTFKEQPWAVNVLPTQPVHSVPIKEIPIPVIEHEHSSIASSAQFHDPQIQTNIVIDPDDAEYKSRSRLNGISSGPNWIKEIM